MSGTYEVPCNAGRALISVSDPVHPQIVVDEKTLQELFKDNDLGEQAIQQVQVDKTMTNTFVVDFDEKSIIAAQKARNSKTSKLTAANLQNMTGPAASQSQVAASTAVNPDQSIDIEAAIAGMAMDPFTVKEANLAATVDARDLVKVILKQISAQAQEVQNKKGKGTTTKGWKSCVYRMEKKVQETNYQVSAKVKQIINIGKTVSGVFDEIKPMQSASTGATLQKHGIPSVDDMFGDL